MYSQYKCVRNKKDMLTHHLSSSTTVHPWVLEYYSAIGINNFKYVTIAQPRADYRVLSFMEAYLYTIENGIQNYPAYDYFKNVFCLDYVHIDRSVKLSEIIPLFPDIRHFIKHGHECAINCGVNCFYCKECADKIKAALKLED